MLIDTFDIKHVFYCETLEIYFKEFNKLNKELVSYAKSKRFNDYSYFCDKLNKLVLGLSIL